MTRIRQEEVPRMEFKKGKVTASLEALAVYNTVTTEAIFEILVEKGVLTKDEVLERVAKLKRITQITIERIQ
jgi:hypothetical protein